MRRRARPADRRRGGHDDFRSLLAAGLALVIGVQAFIIAAGNLKLIPLTGITLPFISYGGSSLLANALVVGPAAGALGPGRRAAAGPARPTPPVPPLPAREGDGHDARAARADGRDADPRRPRPQASLARHRRERLPDRHRRRRARSRSSPSAPAGGRSSRRSGSRPRPTTPRSSRSPGGPCAARSWTATASGSPAATATTNGEATRVYRDATVSHVVGYASRMYGTAGLERAYNAELLGLAGADPLGDLPRSSTAPSDRRLGLRLSLDLRLQRAAVKALGNDRGAVVMLDPATGEILALASTPTYDASAIANPATATTTFERLQADDDRPLLPRATLGRYVPGSVFKIVTAIAALDTRGGRAVDDVRGAAGGRGGRARRRGVPGPRRPPSADRRHGARPDGRDRGQLQHLVRARRPADRRRPARGRGREARVRGAAPVRPADGDQPRDDGRRQRAGRLRRRRRAGDRVVRPGRDLRDAAPDGARGVDGRQRRRADAAPPRDGADRRRARRAHDRPRGRGAGS